MERRVLRFAFCAPRPSINIPFVYERIEDLDLEKRLIDPRSILACVDVMVDQPKISIDQSGRKHSRFARTISYLVLQREDRLLELAEFNRPELAFYGKNPKQHTVYRDPFLKLRTLVAEFADFLTQESHHLRIQRTDIHSLRVRKKRLPKQGFCGPTFVYEGVDVSEFRKCLGVVALQSRGFLKVLERQVVVPNALIATTDAQKQFGVQVIVSFREHPLEAGECSRKRITSHSILTTIVVTADAIQKSKESLPLRKDEFATLVVVADIIEAFSPLKPPVHALERINYLWMFEIDLQRFLEREGRRRRFRGFQVVVGFLKEPLYGRFGIHVLNSMALFWYNKRLFLLYHFDRLSQLRPPSVCRGSTRVFLAAPLQIEGAGAIIRNMTERIVAPSVLSADFSRLGEAVAEIEASKAEWVHLDVMDGAFVPNLTFGPKTVADLRPLTKATFDVHLMTERPEALVASFAEAGADYITFHIEACVHAHRLTQSIRELGAKPGISLVPSTPISVLEDILPYVDIVLVMTVNPGFGGQTLIPSCLEKARRLSRIREERNLSFLISADGGLNMTNAGAAREAGVDVIVAGSAFFGAQDKAAAVRSLRG